MREEVRGVVDVGELRRRPPRKRKKLKVRKDHKLQAPTSTVLTLVRKDLKLQDVASKPPTLSVRKDLKLPAVAPALTALPPPAPPKPPDGSEPFIITQEMHETNMNAMSEAAVRKAATALVKGMQVAVTWRHTQGDLWQRWIGEVVRVGGRGTRIEYYGSRPLASHEGPE